MLALLANGASTTAHAQAWDVDSVRAFMDQVPASVSGGRIDPKWTSDGRLLFLKEGAITEVSLETGAGSRLKEPCLEDQTDKALDKALADLCSTLGKTAQKPRPKIVRRMFPMYGYDRRETTSPNGAWLATLEGPDIVFKDANSKAVVVRTQDGTPTRRWFYGYDIWEASEDAWSADSARFVARSHDVSALPGIAMVDYVNAPSEVRRFRYWARAGDPLPITTFSVFDVKAKRRVDIDTGATAQIFAFFVRWLPDNRHFAFIRYSRDLKRQELVFADSETGKTETVLTRTVKRGWVKWPSGPVGLHFLKGDGGFLWRSDEDGYFHWYHHRMDGARVRQVTHGDFSVQGIVTIADDTLFFMASSDMARPYDQHLNRVALAGKDQRQLTQRPGLHRAVASPNGKHFVVYHESLSVPTSSQLMDQAGTVLAELDRAKVDMAIRKDWPAPEEFVAKSADGKDTIHGIIFKPHGFDPSKRYPIIERIYGGMQSQVMPRGYPGANSRGAGSEYLNLLPYLNSLGFVIVTMDSPGTPGRGRAYNLKTHGAWPDGIIADHAAALRQVAKSRPWMDISRVGVAGNSWGGTLAAHAMKDAPDLYKAASLSVADVDMSDGSHWIEWHLGTKTDNPEGYAGKSAADLAKAIEGHLLIIAGTSDANVPVSNTMKLLDALAAEGKRYELVLFPGTNHIHRNAASDARYDYAVNRLGQFFSAHLGGPQK
ncbi:MAG: DPP IV N-terminal domain-containing protein [Pseudomonadota bacterium]